MRVEFRGGRLDGLELDWPPTQPQPGTELVDKPSGQLYRYHLPSSAPGRAVYTWRPEDSAN